MNFKKDEDAYAKHQENLIKGLASSIHYILSQSTDLEKEELYDLTETLTFSVCSDLDGISSVTKNTVPFLTYIDQEDTATAYWDNGSGLHSVAQEIVEELFEDDLVDAEDPPQSDCQFAAVVKFESGIAMLLDYSCLDSDRENIKAFARKFHDLIEPITERPMSPNSRKPLTDISPVYSKVTEIRIVTEEASLEPIELPQTWPMSTVELVDHIKQFVPKLDVDE